MEDVLEVYRRPYDEHRPQVCLDEASKQLVADTRERMPMRPGRPERYDYEYEGHGVCNLFLACEPLAGKRVVSVSQRRTKRDWAHFVRDLIDVYYPQAEQIVLVMDNLNTHVIGSLYETFAPAEARRLVEKLEIHYTPKHGSWLNMAEIELAVLTQHGLPRRLASQEEVSRLVETWQERRNQKSVKVDWRFTTADARIKLKRLYPSIDVSLEE